MKKVKVLFYDIETTLLIAYLFSLGKNVVRHTQLMSGADMWGIICITYCWNDDKPAKTIKWTSEKGMKGIIEEFDKLVGASDLTIGKNSNRFDSKMINAIRMFEGLPGMPEWMQKREDLEVQMRRYFRVPSQSLDYYSSKLGLGGKNKMEFSDWIDISQYMQAKDLNENIDNKSLDYVCKRLFKKSRAEVMRVGKVKFNKMCTYGAKDTEDTRTLWFKLCEHFDPKFNMASFSDIRCCKHFDCGSQNLRVYDRRLGAGKTMYELYRCRECERYAGRSPISPVKKIVGRIG